MCGELIFIESIAPKRNHKKSKHYQLARYCRRFLLYIVFNVSLSYLNVALNIHFIIIKYTTKQFKVIIFVIILVYILEKLNAKTMRCLAKVMRLLCNDVYAVLLLKYTFREKEA